MGSQLQQLKSKLKTAGLSRSNSSSSKKDRKKDQRAHPDVRAKRLAEIDSSLNLFDKKQSKQKFEVIGRRIPGQLGRPAQSKQAGLEARRKTLLPELLDRHRTGGVVDRRFGEDDPNMTPEDKALARFTRERQQQRKRGSAFDLEGAAEEGLTHYGQSLGLLDDSDAAPAPVNVAAEADPDRPRTRKEIMQEVIAKAKMHKAERQRNADEDETLREELDGDMAELRSLLKLPDRPRAKLNPPVERAPIPTTKTGEGGAESGVDRALLASLIGDGDSDDGGATKARQTPGDDEYDRFVREFAFERRGKPSDRTKTDEEIAREASEALEKAERRRLARMEGREDELSDGGIDVDKPRKRRKLGRAPEADDLDDDFAASDEDGDQFGLGKGLGVSEPLSYRVVDGEVEALGGEDEEDEEDDAEAAVVAIDGEVDDESEEDDEDESGEEEEDESALGLDVDDLLSDGDEAATAEKPARSSRSARPAKSRPAKPELAFTFPCPSTHDELLDILSGVERGQEATVIQRIRVLHNARLHPDNSAKLQTLLGVLLEHALYSASQADFAAVNALTPHVFALASAYPVVAAERFVEQLKAGHEELVENLPEWPSPADLTLLRLIGLVWSTSDLSHPVAAPALLFICQSLAQCRVRSAADLATGLFLCTLVLQVRHDSAETALMGQYESLSQRVVPEVINFLASALLILGPHKFSAATAPGSMPIPDAFSSELAALKLVGKAPKVAVSASAAIDLVAVLTDDGEPDESTKAGLLRTTCTLLGRFAEMDASLDGFIELFTPAHAILSAFPPSSHASTIGASTRTALERMLRVAQQSRRPLQMQAHKPIPIASYAPKFEAGFAPGRHFDPDAERNEQAKLKALHRKERKGAIRELRKDNRFLAGERAKMRDQSDDVYKKKISRIKAGLQSERSEQKSFQRARAADKKRAKK